MQGGRGWAVAGSALYAASPCHLPQAHPVKEHTCLPPAKYYKWLLPMWMHTALNLPQALLSQKVLSLLFGFSILSVCSVAPLVTLLIKKLKAHGAVQNSYELWW